MITEGNRCEHPPPTHTTYSPSINKSQHPSTIFRSSSSFHPKTVIYSPSNAFVFVLSTVLGEDRFRFDSHSHQPIPEHGHSLEHCPGKNIKVHLIVRVAPQSVTQIMLNLSQDNLPLHRSKLTSRPKQPLLATRAHPTHSRPLAPTTDTPLRPAPVSSAAPSGASSSTACACTRSATICTANRQPHPTTSNCRSHSPSTRRLHAK